MSGASPGTTTAERAPMHAIGARRVQAAGIETHLQETGDGTPTFLVHGNPDTGDQWLPFCDGPATGGG
jgi:hypothetical protein